MKENYTPETDAAQIFLGFTPDEGDYFVPVKTAHKLERERDEAREKIELSREWSAAIADIADNLRSELAAVTEQRDRLAMALERILSYQGRFAEEDPESIAAEALAAVKGGQS